MRGRTVSQTVLLRDIVPPLVFNGFASLPQLLELDRAFEQRSRRLPGSQLSLQETSCWESRETHPHDTVHAYMWIAKNMAKEYKSANTTRRMIIDAMVLS